MSEPAVTIRVAGRADSRTLEFLARFAARSRPPAGTALLAERDDVPVAAIRLTSGTVLADPCSATLDAVRALKLTRYRIMRQGGQTGAARALLSLPGKRLVAAGTRALADAA